MASKKNEPKAETPVVDPPVEPEKPTRKEQVDAWTAPQPHDLDKLLEKGNLLARYLVSHGEWEQHYSNTHLGGRTTRVLRYCGCDVCTDARAELGLTD